MDGLNFLSSTTERLNLSYCNNLTDQHLKDLVHCQALNELNIEGSSSLTGESFEVSTNLPSLDSVFIDDCPNMTLEGLQRLIQS